ncbi:hypothetical protein AB205_0157520, partial [Aquarana catesbeiana]
MQLKVWRGPLRCDLDPPSEVTLENRLFFFFAFLFFLLLIYHYLSHHFLFFFLCFPNDKTSQ